MHGTMVRTSSKYFKDKINDDGEPDKHKNKNT